MVKNEVVEVLRPDCFDSPQHEFGRLFSFFFEIKSVPVPGGVEVNSSGQTIGKPCPPQSPSQKQKWIAW